MTQPPSISAGDIQKQFAKAVQEHSGWFLAEGIILVILGILAVLVPQIAALAVTIVLGWLFLAMGVMGLVASFMARQAPGFWWALLSAVLAIVAGVLLLGWPIQGVLSLTYLMIAFFLLEGIMTIMYAVEHRRELTNRWGWMLSSGVVTLILAGIILSGLPGTAQWAIGLLVGIDMIFGGMALIAIATAARNQPA